MRGKRERETFAKQKKRRLVVELKVKVAAAAAAAAADQSFSLFCVFSFFFFFFSGGTATRKNEEEEKSALGFVHTTTAYGTSSLFLPIGISTLTYVIGRKRRGRSRFQGQRRGEEKNGARSSRNRRFFFLLSFQMSCTGFMVSNNFSISRSCVPQSSPFS